MPAPHNLTFLVHMDAIYAQQRHLTANCKTQVQRWNFELKMRHCLRSHDHTCQCSSTYKYLQAQEHKLAQSL